MSSNSEIDSGRLLRGSNPAGGEMNEDDSQIEQHLSFVESGANTATRRRAHYRRNLLTRAGMIIGPILILSGIIVGVSIVMTGKNDSGDEGLPTESSSSSTTVHLVPPPSNLEATCSALLVNTGNETEAAADSLAPPPADDDAELACRELCEPAECCHFPSSFSLSCLLGNEESCMTYHTSCQVMENYGSGKKTSVVVIESNTNGTESSSSPIPPAPTYLQELCSPTSLLTIDGFGECQAECDRAECCWEGGCPEYKEECVPYAPCLHLGATDHKASNSEEIPTYLTEACQDLTSLDGRTKCRTSCQTALCCFPQGPGTSTTTTSCLHDDDDFCSQYTICNSLESNSEVIATADEIKEACGNQDLKSYTHLSLCEVECERGACCFTEGGSSCSEDANVDCTNTYAPCAFLYGEGGGAGGGEEEGPTDDGTEEDDDDDTLVVVTDDDITEGNEEEDDDQYEEEGGEEEGGGVEEEGIDDVHIMKQQVDDTCAGYTTREEAEGTDCQEICTPGLCCYDGTACPENFSCRVYDSCEILHGLMDDEDAIKAEVETACIGADPTEVDTNWEHPCHVLCGPVSCCFDEAVSCEEHGPPNVKCKLYDACDVLYYPSEGEPEGEGTEAESNTKEEVDIVGFTVQDVTDGCHANDLACRDICGAARCCFTTDEACAPGITCDAFGECVKYFGGDPIIGEAGPEELELVEPTVISSDQDEARPELPQEGMGPDDMELISSPYGN